MTDEQMRMRFVKTRFLIHIRRMYLPTTYYSIHTVYPTIQLTALYATHKCTHKLYLHFSI